jgi:hypothetical protein
MQSSYLFFHFVKHQGNRRLLCERLIPRERCGHAILFQGATKVKARGSGSYEQNGAHTIQRTDKGSGWLGLGFLSIVLTTHSNADLT